MYFTIKTTIKYYKENNTMETLLFILHETRQTLRRLKKQNIIF